MDNNISRWIIRPETRWFQWDLSEVWDYRHLMFRLVRRDFLLQYQQTILGPLWIVLQPLIVLFTYVIIFDRVIGLSTDGTSPVLFYLSGIILWNLFAESFTGASFTLLHHGSLFGKVYFPRIVIPLAAVAGSIARFFLQFSLFLALYFSMSSDKIPGLHQAITSLLCALFVALFGLGTGLIFSIVTAKYRDLVNINHLFVRLLMFATPIIYPLSIVNDGLVEFMLYNPLSVAVEAFRFSFLGQGTYTITALMSGVIITIASLLAGTLLFNKYSNKLQDVL